MKHLKAVCLLAVFLAAVLFLNAQQPTMASTVKKAKGDMQGAYTLLKQVVNDGTKDSTMQVEQQKIYTRGYMMYAHQLPNDSLAEYGIGTYTIENGKLVEDVFYTSSNGDQKTKVELGIRKTGDGYIQVINFPADSQGVRYTLTEDYKTVSQALSTPLDGAWKQTRSTFTPKNGKITGNTSPTQFKVFESGHFIWASTVKDSLTQKPISFFGYGTFGMKGNEVTENNTQTTFAHDLLGKPVTLQIQFTGNDSYTQTIVWPNGDQSVEVYQRLK
jgi:hypothetical protein